MCLPPGRGGGAPLLLFQRTPQVFDQGKTLIATVNSSGFCEWEQDIVAVNSSAYWPREDIVAVDSCRYCQTKDIVAENSSGYWPREDIVAVDSSGYCQREDIVAVNSSAGHCSNGLL